MTNIQKLCEFGTYYGKDVIDYTYLGYDSNERLNGVILCLSDGSVSEEWLTDSQFDRLSELF